MEVYQGEVCNNIGVEILVTYYTRRREPVSLVTIAVK